MPTIRLQLPHPHNGQSRIFREAKRFNVIACGRRFGKTVAGINRMVGPALEAFPVAWASPTYRMMSEIWRETKKTLAPVTASFNVSERRIELITGGVIDFWSMTDPDSIRGRKYKRFIIDEAAMIGNLGVAWQEVIRPTLTEYEGDAFMLSTPKGRNAFWEFFQRGLDPLYPDWAAFQMPTVTNPHIKPSEVEAAKRRARAAARFA